MADPLGQLKIMFHNILLRESHEISRIIEDTICKRCQREWIDYFLSSMIMMPVKRLEPVVYFLNNTSHYF